jgi:hypothetical protein
LRNGVETVEVDKRGQRNNGNIVVVPDEVQREEMDYEDRIVNKRKYRVPEQIIKLDFLARLKGGKP